MMDEKFEWPCGRRVAHGKHVIRSLRTEVASRMSGEDKSRECPGVKAHPATMIGGRRPEEEWR